MSKVLLLGAPLLLIIFGLPLMVVFVIAGTQAAQDCARSPGLSAGGTLAGVSGELGDIDAPVGGSVSGKVSTAVANLPNRKSNRGFAASVRRLAAPRPDFLMLNEVGRRTAAALRAGPRGYDVYRDPNPDRTRGGPGQSMNNVVMWRTDRWQLLDGGRIKIVDDDTGYHHGHRFTWDRYATWAVLQRNDGAIVSVVSTHMMTNPAKFPRQHGNPAESRTQRYGRGMDVLIGAVASLAEHGPVLVGGDMNSHPRQGAWTAAAKMTDAGFRYAKDRGVMYLFYPNRARPAGSRQVRVASDHLAILSTLDMNGAGPIGPSGEHGEQPRAVPAGNSRPSSEVQGQLMRLRFAENDPTLTAAQARNAIAIAQVARDLQVPRYGLQVAIATAIQESKLENLDHGDLDSVGLFQQRGESGWGTKTQRMDPVLAAKAFFGRAQHTNNRGLLDVPGWQSMGVGEIVDKFQNPGTPYDDYDQWEDVAGDIADLLGGDLPAIAATSETGDCAGDIVEVACASGTADYDLGPVKPQLARLVSILGPKFGIKTVGGYRESATDPNGHPAGLAADFMVPMTAAGKAQGDALAAYAQRHAKELGIDYIIWRQRIWSVARAGEGWRPMENRGSPPANHMDHPHINVLPDASGASAAAATSSPGCGDVVYPVAPNLASSNSGSWHETGSWSRWHTGTDFGVACGTAVYAAHAGTVEIDTSQSWAGPHLVKVTQGASSLTTWYAHMQHVTVSRGQRVQAGQQIGVVGNEGQSFGCHLHFEVHLKNGSMYGDDNTDPSAWLAENARTPLPPLPA